MIPILFLILCSLQVQSQSNFHFLGKNTKEVSFRFQLINNLMVIPVTINGKSTSFILDTGVDKTIVFNVAKNDSIGLNNIEKITLQGLGGGEPVAALRSKNNSMQIKEFSSANEDVYVILSDTFDVSGRMGVTVHGVIGYQIFKDAIVHVNYASKKITLYNPKTYASKKCKRCQTFPIQFYRNKPYIDVKVQLDSLSDQRSDVKLLIDTGGSSALWLFENTKDEIQTPKNHFRAILGEGLSGTIYGNKSRIKGLNIGSFYIKNPTVSFLDSTSTQYARQFSARNGSIGGNVLKRFKLWIDYQNKKITFKKKGSFRGGFEYDMSGIDVVYNGKVLVKERAKTVPSDSYMSTGINDKNTIRLVTNYIYKFKPSFKVQQVLLDSPAYHAGIEKGDIILSVNGTRAFELTLAQLIAKFQERDQQKVKMTIERRGVQKKFEFRLIRKI